MQADREESESAWKKKIHHWRAPSDTLLCAVLPRCVPFRPVLVLWRGLAYAWPSEETFGALGYFDNWLLQAVRGASCPDHLRQGPRHRHLYAAAFFPFPIHHVETPLHGAQLPRQALLVKFPLVYSSGRAPTA